MTFAQMLELEAQDRETFQLTEQDLAQLHQYVEHGYAPSGFYLALLENNLQRAALTADPRNRRKLFEYICWLTNHAPPKAWGTREKVSAWVALKEKERYRHE